LQGYFNKKHFRHRNRVYRHNNNNTLIFNKLSAIHSPVEDIMKKIKMIIAAMAVLGAVATAQADELSLSAGIYNPNFDMTNGVKNTYKNGWMVEGQYGVFDINQYATIFGVAGFAEAKARTGTAGKLRDLYAGAGVQAAGNLTSRIVGNVAGSLEYHSLKDTATGVSFTQHGLVPVMKVGVDYAMSGDKAVGAFVKQAFGNKAGSTSYGVTVKALF